MYCLVLKTYTVTSVKNDTYGRDRLRLIKSRLYWEVTLFVFFIIENLCKCDLYLQEGLFKEADFNTYLTAIFLEFKYTYTNNFKALTFRLDSC